jgi:DNA repair protein RecN (Recombination protein N)
MLQELKISNLAIIEAAEIACGPGFNVLTGETGAGKSIVIDALGLLMGERAASEQVGTAGRAVIEGAFDVSKAPAARKYLHEHEIEAEDGALVVTREVSADGRSRVRLNGRMATAAALRELGATLIDLHGQHDSQALLRPESHLGFLDAFGDAAHQAALSAVRDKWSEWRRAHKRLDELTRDEQARAQRLDMLRFQAEELDAAKLQENEDALLADERARLMNAEKLREDSGLCRDCLSGDSAGEPGALGLLRSALKSAREIEGVDKGVAPWVERLESALYEIDDIATEAAAYAETLEADPARLEEIEARLHLLNRLKRKYGDSIERVLAHQSKIGREIARLSVSEDELAGLRDEADALRDKYLTQARKLSAARQKLAQDFEKQVVRHLHTLAMEKSRFSVHFESDDAGAATGVDRVEFLLSANPGQPLRPLSKIASGGEISRVMLALRSVLGSHPEEKMNGEGADGEASTPVPVLIFDEVDVGIGGVTAEAVGEKMQELARSFQVFCVTHLPQIARRADHHYRVVKSLHEEHTRVEVRPLDDEERVCELARMMGRESEANLRHARELLDEARRARAGLPGGTQVQVPGGGQVLAARNGAGKKARAKI